MAKTIYEMAVSYATEDISEGKTQVIEIEKDAAIYGANYVLEEVERIVTNPKLFDEERVYEIEQLIRELKGE